MDLKNFIDIIKTNDVKQMKTMFNNCTFVSNDDVAKLPVLKSGHYIVYTYNTLRRCTEGPAIQVQDFFTFLRNLSLLDLEKAYKKEAEDINFKLSMIEKFPTEYTFFILGALDTESCDLVKMNFVLKGSLLDYYSSNSKTFYYGQLEKLKESK